MKSTYAGPRIGTKLIILMSLALLVIPWFSYLYLREMEAFLVESQAEAQLLTAEGVSTLLNGRKDLFYDLPLSPEGYDQLYAHELDNPINIDGKNNDWEDILDFALIYGDTQMTADTEQRQSNFTLLLGEHKGQIYALVTVADDSLTFRDRNILRLDLSDHIRITFTSLDGKVKNMVISATEPGVTTAYTVDDEWRYATEGVAENRVQGFVTTSNSGYVMEFRIPLAMLGSTRPFGLAVVDVDEEENRTIKSITGTLPSAETEAIGLVVLKSPEVLKIIRSLGYSGASIQVIDAQSRVRAEVGSYVANQIRKPGEPVSSAWAEAWFSMVRFLLDSIYDLIDPTLREVDNTSEDQVIKASLGGVPNFQRRYDKDEGEMIIAAHPIIAENDIIGTVVLRQNTDRILQLRRDALERTIQFSVLSLIIFVIFILAFSVRLARRIRKLGAETINAIDSHGRLQTDQLRSETRSGDEIGDLARSISNMLSKLHQHNQFLENMPRTLRHEINNPLNTLTTSLHNLEMADSSAARTKYLESAKRGVMRIGMIVQNLADAASLEEALESEELEVVDLYKLVQSYMTNCQVTHNNRKFEYRGTSHNVLAKVSDYRIEQLLDKLVDNAIDFSGPGSTIVMGLTKDDRSLSLFVSNRGKCIPTDALESIFDSMVSVRDSNPDNRLHFGMGLYVVRVIAEYHGGSVTATNLINDQGVTIRVSLPLHHPQTVEHAFAAS
jgi:two-component system sensor histidine kinase ChvG